MPRFDNRDIAFDPPDGWEDKTIIAYEAPNPTRAPVASNVTLMRIEGTTGSLQTYVTQQVAALGGTLPKFELTSQRTLTFGGLPAVELLYQWDPPSGGLTQRSTVFLRGGKVWSFTATAMRGAFAQAAPMFDRIANSLRFVGDAPPPSNSGGFPPSSESIPSGSVPPIRPTPRGW